MGTTLSRKPKPPNLLRKVKLDGAWRYVPVARVAVGKAGAGGFDWGKIVYRGKTIAVSSGTFHLEYRVNGRKQRPAVGTDPKIALRALVTQGTVRALRHDGVEAGDAPEIQRRTQELTGPRIAEAVAAWIKAPPVKLRDRSVAKYTEAMHSFVAWSRTARKTHISQLGRQDVLDFLAWLVREKGLSLSTAKDKAVVVLPLLQNAGCAIAMQKGDWPRSTTLQPVSYRPEQLKAIFAAMREDEATLYMTFLLTGFRKQEVMFLSWPDLNPRQCTLKVSKKKGFQFDPKSYAERTISVHPVLVERLKRHKVRQSEGAFLVFGTSDKNIARGQMGGGADEKMLEKLKRIALRGGLNCGRCQGTWCRKPASCKDRPICRDWTLHRFRHTYASGLLQDGFDIVSVQEALGHAEIKTTMRYLRAMRRESFAAKIGQSTLAGMFG